MMLKNEGRVINMALNYVEMDRQDINNDADHLWLNFTEAGAALNVVERTARSIADKEQWPVVYNDNGNSKVRLPKERITNPRYMDQQTDNIASTTQQQDISTLVDRLQQQYESRLIDKQQVIDQQQQQITIMQNEDRNKTTALQLYTDQSRQMAALMEALEKHNRPWWQFWQNKNPRG